MGVRAGLLVLVVLGSCGGANRSVRLYADDCDRLRHHMAEVTGEPVPASWDGLCRESLRRPQYDCIMATETLAELNSCPTDPDSDVDRPPPPPAPGRAGAVCDSVDLVCDDGFECCGDRCIASMD